MAMRYRFNIKNLRDAAARVGDNTDYKIAQRTGLSQSTISRLAAGNCQPRAATQAAFYEAYQVPLNELMTIEPFGAVAA
ncbi:MAG: helix-turn-helix transcriptional regulator [Streptomyces sp.]|nr:helix-turn-helix transcriptional regulator [Streptomyces sp.]NUS24396.1 helix-turn-helix transcriptional regulator [Streptomyces sp.]